MEEMLRCTSLDWVAIPPSRVKEFFLDTIRKISDMNFAPFTLPLDDLALCFCLHLARCEIRCVWDLMGQCPSGPQCTIKERSL